MANIKKAPAAGKAPIDKEQQMAVGRKGLWLMVAGLIVMACGFMLLTGGGSEDPKVFNYDMFDFRRLVAAPIVIVCGIIVELAAILGWYKKAKDA